MNPQLQTLFLIILILVSVAITNVSLAPSKTFPQTANIVSSVSVSQNTGRFLFEKTSVQSTAQPIKKLPTRNWDVLDPQINAKSVLIESLDDSFPFLHVNTYTQLPTASLAKLLTAVVVMEDIGENKKITITERAVATEGSAGGLKTNEIYGAQDLMKIMLLTSSNDAATAFEDYAGSFEFVRMLNQKAKKIGMQQAIFFDASGLSDLNTANASDLLKLIKYIIKEHPEILNWTRIPQIAVQPVNDYNSRVVQNINPFIAQEGFLGGKTGTTDLAKENLIILFSHNDQRMVAIILGSPDRKKELDTLMKWMEKAYTY